MNKVIHKNSNNTLLLTVTENVTMNSPYYLFKLTSHSTNNSVMFYADNISTKQCRYDEFIITETGSTFVNLLSGIIHLDSTGWFTYEVYQNVSQNYDASAANLLELGLLLVKDTDPITYTSQTGNTSYIIYNSNN